MKYEQLAKDILENVGGTENVNSVVHCITRLRFQLKDEGKANTEVLKSMEDVVTVMKSGGQYQVVIGNHVADVYKAVVKVGGFQTKEAENTNDQKKSSFIDIVSSIFTPVLGVLAATGMIKGFNALILALGWLSQESGTYQILNAVGDSLFYFFPIFLGYTASKKFQGAPFIGMAIGGALVYPALAGLTAGKPLYTLFAGTMFESPIHITFLGIPVILMNYASSVIPIILAAYFAAKVEKALKKIIPDVVKTFLVPFFTLLIVVPITFLVIGPIATWAGQFLGQATLWAYHLSPLVAGIFLGAFWQLFVIFGLHWGIVPIGFNNLAVHGEDPILALIFAASFAQIGAVLGVWIKTNEKKLKELSIPAFISGIFGVTEPAIYGITLPQKKPFIISCIAGGIGGGILGVFGTKAYMAGGLGIFQIPTFISSKTGITAGLWGSIIAMIVAFVLGFVLTYLFGIKKKEQSVQVDPAQTKLSQHEDVRATMNSEVIASPFYGEVKLLKDIEDAAFASGVLGKGVAIEPSEGKLFSPVSGTVSALFPTNHALGITTETGAELLIHIGMDTVKLDGKFFTSHIAQGDYVEKGQLLIEFNIAEIQKAGYIVTTPVVVTNHDQYNVMIKENGQVTPEESVIELEVK
ncbi:beta-glucoside-specific PTS transporter subunit IIABC [Bacillus cytotoxicus]|uniref:beta-glucoside-specific PTS transporter subunit IIABC n=1 Tax=Bacillus cereus group sp. BfR-BA-01492 TaxID=2920361 RepID=UPI001F57067F|nr:beta-glucoside-specific PTS transporter subunit IIABC [Bacillus cereus group sp. BfR-BA-01492]EMA6344544.1 PTS glucose transporter subunit IIA [Bacillus cytotoxicus]